MLVRRAPVAIICALLLFAVVPLGGAATKPPQQQQAPQPPPAAPQNAPQTAGLSGPPSAQTLLAQAVELHQAGDTLGAIAAYEAALKLEPENAGAHSNLGAALVRLGRYDQAITHYRKAIAIDPSNGLFQFNLALAEYKSSDIPTAATELKHVVDTDKNNPNARVLLGDCYLQMGRFQDVVDLLSPLEAELGDDRAFAYVLGSALVETDHGKDAERVIDRIFRGGESAEGHLLMATAHLRAADGPAAVAELKQALALKPSLPIANALMGRALLRSGDQEGAMRAFRRELEVNPNNFDANLQLAELKKRDEQFDDALTYVQRALRMRPSDASARFSLAGIDVGTGKNDAAREILEQVVKDKPKFTEAYVMLATVYYRLNRKADGDRVRAIVEQLNAEAAKRNERVKD
jgi:tetratricopeptide (TPR) repeat protein